MYMEKEMYTYIPVMCVSKMFLRTAVISFYMP